MKQYNYSVTDVKVESETPTTNRHDNRPRNERNSDSAPDFTKLVKYYVNYYTISKPVRE